jgi:flagellar hook-associated protein 2
MAAIDGLSSGLDTTSIINQLMALERAPQQRLQSKQSAAESSIGSLRTLNTKFASVLSAAAKLGARLASDPEPTPPPPSEWQPAKATSSDTARVTASAGAGATAGSLSFNVTQLASTTTKITDATWGATTAVVATDGSNAAIKGFTLTKGATSTVITTESGTLAQTVAAINAKNVGVRAGIVQTAPNVYALQLTSTTSGASGDITLQADGKPAAFTSKGSLGQDAVLDVSGIAITSTSNTFKDVLPGVTLTVTKADTQKLNGAVPFSPPQFVEPAVTVDVKKDTDGIAAKVQSLVDAANAARADAKSLTAMDPTTKAKGRLYGDSAVRSLIDKVSSAISGGTSGPALAGVTIARDGTISFDKAKFLTALEADPAKVEAALGKDGLAGRLHKLADEASRTSSAVGGPGLITSAITSRESQIATIKDGIASWDTRLAMKQKQLERTYTGLETALSKAKSQGQWLSGQLANLPTWS